MLHTVCLGENVNRHFSLGFCLVFSIVILLFSTIRSLLSNISLFEFPLIRKSKDPQNRFFDTESMPVTPIPPQNHSAGLSTLFQLNSKPNSSPPCMLQSSGFLVHCEHLISCVILHLAEWERGSGHQHQSGCQSLTSKSLYLMT